MADTKLLAGGVKTDALVHASADQVTILGDGTAENPLHASSSGGSTTFIADVAGGPTYRLGQPDNVTTAVPTIGVAVVIPAVAGEEGSPGVVGLIIDIGEVDPVVTIQEGGIVELSVSLWNHIVGGTTGLTRGQAYYLSDTTAGTLIPSPPSDSGAFTVFVGVALNPTQLLTSTPSRIFRNP